MPLDIQKLADDAVASVEAATRSKTASDTQAAPLLVTEIGRQLKEAAEMLRGSDLGTVTNEDIAFLLKQASVGGTLGGVAGSPGGPAGSVMGAAGADIGAKVSSGTLQASTQAPMGAMTAPKLASALGTELRSLAGNVRMTGYQAEETRLIKAAHMYNAGVALAHLIGEAQ